MITDYLKIEGSETLMKCKKNKKYLSYTEQCKDAIFVNSKY
jgi:hypothetical protein